MPIDATIMQVAIILTGLTLANAKRDSIAVSMTDILSSFSPFAEIGMKKTNSFICVLRLNRNLSPIAR